MGLVTKTFTFSNGNTSDATQVNNDFDTLFAVINGNLDNNNLKANAIQTSNLTTEAVTPAKTEGLPYASDLLGSTGAVISGLTASKNGTTASQVDIATGILYALQTDGSMRRFAPSATNFKTTSASATYYLDFNPDGSWSWTTGHSSQSGYVPICSVTSDASSNVLAVVDTRPMAMFSIASQDATNLKALLLMGGF